MAPLASDKWSLNGLITSELARSSFLHECPQTAVLNNSQKSIDSASEKQRVINSQTEGNLGGYAERQTDLMGMASSSKPKALGP